MADCIELLSDGSFDVDSVHNSGRKMREMCHMF